MDVSRTVNRMGAKKVTVIYRRARKQMPAENEEVEAAINEGVEFLFQTNVVKILGSDKVEKIECIKTELVKVEGDREKPVNIKNSNYLLDMDYVIMALGSIPQNEILEKEEFERTERGYLKIDEDQMTSREGIFASRRYSRSQKYSCMGCKVRQRCRRKDCRIYKRKVRPVLSFSFYTKLFIL